ncbi:hypothetical protein T11_4425 [Trichinella zimbabwensis]|uniref:Uncharacterized protein n=1 Tax=Trichinella zimbabwensis TaxID=268475 RepID=A0A0V1HMC6_9BILA|nr:hypothetical protein T11_4425 [Trichinella zimbabwensis]
MDLRLRKHILYFKHRINLILQYLCLENYHYEHSRDLVIIAFVFEFQINFSLATRSAIPTKFPELFGGWGEEGGIEKNHQAYLNNAQRENVIPRM